MRLNGKGEFGRLGPQELRQFLAAMLDAFPQVPLLDQLFTYYLGRNREALALGNDLRTIMTRVIESAETESWTAELLAAARLARPANDALLAFSRGRGLAPEIPDTPELQRKIKATGGTIDPVPWRHRMGLVEGQVCRVEVYASPATTYGTGFLVGPGVVMTNYHVIESLLRPANPVPPDKVVLRFDYKALADGLTVQAGSTYMLDDQGKWLLDSSRWSKYDETDGPGEPAPDELDYALLAVKGAPGDDPVGGPKIALATAEPRGWVEMPASAHVFKPQGAVWIMQHPQGGPLKMAMDTESVSAINKSGTRVRYTTTTEPGSSGSPCFDSDWNLIALHHAGDPEYPRLARYNQGIPIAAILALMDENGTRKHLGRAH